MEQGIEQRTEQKMKQRMEILLSNFSFFGVGCLLYGIFFAICLYNGFLGISIPVLSVVTIGFLLCGFRYFQIESKKVQYFYIAAWMLLSISNCLTASSLLVFFNVCGMTLLFFSFLLVSFCHTERWGFGKFMLEIMLAPLIAVAFVGYPFKAAARFFEEKKGKRRERQKYIWMGVLISIPLLIVIVALLASADAVFRNLFREYFEWMIFPQNPLWLMFLLTVGTLGSYSLLAYMASGTVKEEVKDKKKAEPLTAITFVSIISFVYLVFSVIQISGLFLGRLALPEGYTYAAYAREGFFQLLFVCLINLCIVLVCIAYFREHKALKAVLTVFSCCTFIMIASSAMRMLLYIQSYQMTFLRLLVLWALVVITLLLTGCIVTIYKKSFPLFGYATAVVTMCYLIFSFAKPDYLIARYNIEASLAGADMDMDYLLYHLSPDALPALAEADKIDRKLCEEYRGRLSYRYDVYEKMGILDFNFSVARSGKILSEYRTVFYEQD